MYISITTIKDTIRKMKTEFAAMNIEIVYKHGYKLTGCEANIRELFLETYYDARRELIISNSVDNFDKNCSLRLTDYSKNSLTAFVDFVSDRISKGYNIDELSVYEKASETKCFDNVGDLFPFTISRDEQIYISAFISSLSSLNTSVPKKEIEVLVDTLIDSIENKLMIFFKNKDECKQNLLRHIASSYYRIKYGFPIHNPLLEEIKYRFKSLFLITKNLFNSGRLAPSLNGIRDEEVAYIVSYLGSYIFKDDVSDLSNYKILIACPNGITISKSIQYQLERHFPQLEIIDSISITEFESYKNNYDYLISTIKVEGVQNNIVVNPILRNFDLDTISRIIFNSELRSNEIGIDDLIEGISKYSEIKDEKNLRKFLYSIIYETKAEEGGSHMLKEILSQDRIKFVGNCNNWMEAIEEAAMPLLEQKMITKEYIEAMIDSVKENGPYIVLDDYFALAHARPSKGVKKLSMSLLKIDNAVDFLGQEVKVIVVLAATDNSKHLEALASLTELLSERENLDAIINASSIEEVTNLIRKYS